MNWWNWFSYPTTGRGAVLLVVTLDYSDATMGAMASQITSLTIVYSTVYSGADQRKYQRSASLAFVLRIHWWPVNFPHKGPVTPKMFTFYYVIMWYIWQGQTKATSESGRCSLHDQPAQQSLWRVNNLITTTYCLSENYVAFPRK